MIIVNCRVHEIRMTSADKYERKIADEVNWDHKIYPLQAVEKQKQEKKS
jgi:hypothetical protein